MKRAPEESEQAMRVATHTKGSITGEFHRIPYMNK